nr:unnamed protein product [Callosobruchus analis]
MKKLVIIQDWVVSKFLKYWQVILCLLSIFTVILCYKQRNNF